MERANEDVGMQELISWRKWYRWTELVLLFVGVPLVYAFGFKTVPLFIVLTIAFVLCLLVLLFDKGYDKRELYRFRNVDWKLIFIRFGTAASLTAALVYFFLPEKFLHLFYEQPGLLAVIIVFYPIWSAYAQEVIYRAFFFRRYAPLIPNKKLLLFSNGLLFAIGHLVFENWIAIVATFFGGILFAITYKKDKSVIASAVEHGLYGDFIYFIGLGMYFYKT